MGAEFLHSFIYVSFMEVLSIKKGKFVWHSSSLRAKKQSSKDKRKKCCEAQSFFILTTLSVYINLINIFTKKIMNIKFNEN